MHQMEIVLCLTVKTALLEVLEILKIEIDLFGKSVNFLIEQSAPKLLITQTVQDQTSVRLHQFTYSKARPPISFHFTPGQDVIGTVHPT